MTKERRPAHGVATAEEAMKSRLAKPPAQARGERDARPGGPHDLAPIHMRVFGVSRAEIEDDERFVGR